MTIEWHIEKRKIKDLKEYSKNPRKLTKDQATHLTQSIEKFGLIDKPFINHDNTIIGGHQRLRMLKKLGYKEIDVMVPSRSLDEKETEELNIRHNKNTGEFDFDILANEFDFKDLLDWGFTAEELLGDMAESIEPATEEDNEVLEPGKDEDAETKLGDIYELNEHRLVCGDSTLPEYVDKCFTKEAELCFTSPPYDDQRDYKDNNDLSPKYLSQSITVSSEKVRFYVVNLGIKRDKGQIIPYWQTWIDSATDSGLKLLSWNVWNQEFSGSVGKLTAMFPICHEWIFVFGSEIKKLNPTVDNKNAGIFNDHSSDRQKDNSTSKKKSVVIRDKRELGTIITLNPQLARDDIDHPARFPIELPIEYIKAMTNKKDVIYDPFLGSGTTLIAAEQLNRTCFGIELSPAYCDIIVNRWIKYMNKNNKQFSIKRNGESIEWQEKK